MVLKSRDYVYKMSIPVFMKLSVVLFSIHWYMYYVHIKKFLVSVLQWWQIGASMLGVNL